MTIMCKPVLLPIKKDRIELENVGGRERRAIQCLKKKQ